MPITGEGLGAPLAIVAARRLRHTPGSRVSSFPPDPETLALVAAP